MRWLLAVAASAAMVNLFAAPMLADAPPWQEGTVEEVPATAPAVRAIRKYRAVQWSGAADSHPDWSSFRLGYRLQTERHALDFGAGAAYRDGALRPFLSAAYEVRPWTVSGAWSSEWTWLRLQWQATPFDSAYFIESFNLGQEWRVGVSGMRWESFVVSASYRLPSQHLQVTLTDPQSGWSVTAGHAGGQVTVSLRWSPAPIIEEVMPSP